MAVTQGERTIVSRAADRLGHTEGRLHARAAATAAFAGTAPTGLHPLGLDAARDSYIYVPESYRPDAPAPLVVMLHGAGGHAHHGLGVLGPLADMHGVILLAPASRDRTWDVIVSGYGADVALIDRALAWVFERYAVDAGRLAVGGFSDGASYALSLGIGNGGLFTHVLAFSPGFVAPVDQEGAPDLFISHGTDDRVLPIGRCSRRIVPMLRRAGYAVEYREFTGGHTIPPEIGQEAVEWFIDRGKDEDFDA